MKKIAFLGTLLVLCIVLLTGCGCQHDWKEADCTTPKTCGKCQATEGDVLGHSWTDASCTSPKTCSVCGLTEGIAPGHRWQEATCTSPRTCSVCAASEGEALPHLWNGEATLYSAPVCTVCGTEGDPLPGYFARNGIAINTRPEQEADYVTNTYIRPDLDTTGKFLASEVLVFEGDAKHRAKPGYEWRRADITINFSDSNSLLYGTNVRYARADYYQDQPLTPADRQERFAVNYNGQEYGCTISYEDAGFYFTDTNSIFHLFCYVQVPIGYDGVVLAFHHGSMDTGSVHLHETKTENMLFFRMA